MKNVTKKLILILTIVMIVKLNAKCQTNVSGGIYANTIWTLANSPYVVTDTVVVFPGVNLTIEPGVTVKFDNNKVIEIRNGSLIANGTISDSIFFTSSSTSPYPGIYAGIFLNGAIISNFNYCNFQYAMGGFQGWAGLDSIICRHSYFKNNYAGIGPIYDAFSTYDSCLFENNYFGMRGYISYYSKVTNSIFNNNVNGVNEMENFTIKQCTFSNNTGTAIYTSQGDSILDCVLTNNDTAINVHQSGGGSIISMEKNLVEFNNVGVLLTAGYNLFIECNKICNNILYDLKNATTSNTNVHNNYWCTTDSSILASHIYDGYDNASVGLITFLPTDTLQCYLNGCNLLIFSSVVNATCDTCHNGSATAIVGNGVAPFTYTWYSLPIQTGQSATNLSYGTYAICITDAQGCTTCDSVIIDSTNCTGFNINANSNSTTCSTCNDGSAWVSISGGTAPYNYTWYTSPIQISDTATGLSQGNYLVCVTDFFGCSFCDSVNVSTGNCSAHFNLYPDTIAHHYYAVNMASGVTPLTYSWDWGDGSLNDTIPYPNHTYASSGFYTICLTITDSVGCTNTYCSSYYLMKTTNTMVFVNVIPQVGTGTFEEQNDILLTVYPNPVSDYLTIKLSEISLLNKINIYNLFGELKLSTSINGGKKIKVSQLPSGVYFLEVYSKTQIRRVKFVKK